MKKRLLIVFGIILFSTFSFGQNRIWNKVADDKIVNLEKMERISYPEKFELFSLNFEGFKQQLINAPKDIDGVFSNVIVDFPTPEGKLQRYRIYEAPIMEAELANKFPNIKSYVAVGLDDVTSKLRFSVTLFGLHSMSLSGETGTFYIDTYTKDLNNYIIYKRKDVPSTRTFGCLVQDDHEQIAQDFSANKSAMASDGLFRQYRLAMACTIEYAAFHVNAAGLGAGTLAQKKAAVLSAMNITMTRVNGLYERDMSLRMNLVANNDLVIFIDLDAFDNNNASTLINQSQTVIDGAIGFANYDIGHTVSTGGGGLAQLNSPCTASKARGITGSPAPVGDPYDIDYVAHEMGHQFGGTHTFNNSCGGNRSAGTAVEPGSGSTIMAYAGICAPNVQNNSDAHFHAVSLAQMSNFVAGTGSCATSVANNNIAPVVNAGTDFTIPKGTPFILKGSATDANGDALTYCWEQTDNTVSTQPPLQANAAGPNFRSNAPISSPNRYMPAFSSVLAGNLAPTWEVVPNVARTMNFALTVRDNRMPNGGQTSRDNTVITTSSVGPFIVTSPTNNASWNVSSSQTITWDVAGTTGNGINTANVNILISTDNGATFTTLVANTINDGTEAVTMPSSPALNCRIMIEAVGNIFYALSPNFSVGYTITTTCNTYTASPATPIAAQNPLAWQIVGTVNVPTSVTISDINLGVNLSHTNINDLYVGVLKPGATTVGEIVVVYQQGCASGVNMITTFDDEGAALNCAGITGGNSYTPLNSLSSLDGLNSLGNWRLVIADVAVPNNGTVNSFSVEICSTTSVLTSETFGLTDFSLYPNPNNGNFTVQFSSETANNVNITVHDLRGREIFSKEFQNNGLFSQELQLNNASSGIYLVTVQDGSRKEVKKIVVE